MIAYPQLQHLSKYQQDYISMVPSHLDLLSALDFSARELEKELKKVTEEKSTYQYEAGKWSIKKLLMHITDADRIFTYRALCIARGETCDLPSFDENSYADESYADEVKFADIFLDFKISSAATLSMFSTMKEEIFSREGKANGNVITPAIIGFLMAGHRLHHLKILKERYL